MFKHAIHHFILPLAKPTSSFFTQAYVTGNHNRKKETDDKVCGRGNIDFFFPDNFMVLQKSIVLVKQREIVRLFFKYNLHFE